MTIVLAIPTTDGIILASDSQITAGQLRTRGKKIKKLNENCIWGASGRGSLIQRVEEKLDNLPRKNNSLAEIRDDLSKAIKECVKELFNMDQQLPSEDFVFVDYQKGPRILHIDTNGTPEWIDTGVFGIGIGRSFVHTLLEKYHELVPNKINVEKGALLAFKVIEEAIEVGAYGLGPPIDIWCITNSMIKNFSVTEVDNLRDKCLKLRKDEMDLLIKD